MGGQKGAEHGMISPLVHAAMPLKEYIHMYYGQISSHILVSILRRSKVTHQDPDLFLRCIYTRCRYISSSNNQNVAFFYILSGVIGSGHA